MIKKITLLLPLIGFVFFGLNNQTSHSNASGPPIFNAGAPGMSSCGNSNACHNTNETNSGPGMASITFDSNTAQYNPNETYNLSVSVEQDNAARYGFQMVAFNEMGESIGNFITGSDENINVSTNGNIQYIQHQSVGPNNDNTFSFQWTAPDTLLGNITFYAAINAANGDGGPSGDFIYTVSQTITEFDIDDPDNWAVGVETVNAANVKIFPNPVKDQLVIQNIENIQQVLLYDAKGDLLQSYPENSSVLTIDVKYPTGVYFLKIVTANKIVNQRIMIQ